MAGAWSVETAEVGGPAEARYDGLRHGGAAPDALDQSTSCVAMKAMTPSGISSRESQVAMAAPEA